MPATLAMPTSVPLRRARASARRTDGTSRRGRGCWSRRCARMTSRSSRIGGVDADADAGIGDDDVGQPLRGDAGAAGGGDRVDVAHIGAVDAPSAPASMPCALAQRRDLGGAPRDQREPVAGAVEARGQRLADAARGAGDEDERPLRPAGRGAARRDGAHGAGGRRGETKVALRDPSGRRRASGCRTPCRRRARRSSPCVTTTGRCVRTRSTLRNACRKSLRNSIASSLPCTASRTTCAPPRSCTSLPSPLASAPRGRPR